MKWAGSILQAFFWLRPVIDLTEPRRLTLRGVVMTEKHVRILNRHVALVSKYG